MSAGFLDLYEPLDVIGNGSFGLIRKVRRKADGMIFARKELNFDKMSDRDRKQIVAEVNILKDLHHDHIVRYHDRHVDRDAGILYILMEYCSGGDLSSIIKQAQKSGRLIPEDTVWNYFTQILLALQHCHHPNGQGHTRSGSIGHDVEGNKERRSQILHRDLKPDNVFLGANNQVKLGDFGLAKALVQANFANTYVGTPYYMSPELMQEKAYDSKSDIWSLGCLLYELCALKPPFHEAKTHNELSNFIRNGRIPPLPKCYSQTLEKTIKSMLNLNPAVRPSALGLLASERIDHVLKVFEMERMLNAVKAHKATVSSKEREVNAREQELMSKEAAILAALSEKDAEIAHLKQMLAQQEHVVHEAVARREEELRIMVMQREEEVSAASSKREEEIMQAVRQREEMLCDALRKNEMAIREKEESIGRRAEELKREESRISEAKAEIEAKIKAWESREKDTAGSKVRRDKGPLEEVKNLLARMTHDESPPSAQTAPTTRQRMPNHLHTPLTRNISHAAPVGSAMRGVVFTATGEALCTPAPALNLMSTPQTADLVSLFVNSPKVGLEFSKIFDKPSEKTLHDSDDDEDDPSPPPSPSKRHRPRSKSTSATSTSTTATSPEPSSALSTPTNNSAKDLGQPSRPTRIRRPSITRSSSTKSGSSSSTAFGRTVSQPDPMIQPLSHPHLHQPRSVSTSAIVLPPPPSYDLNDEENLPSPFLKRTASADQGGNARKIKSLTKRTSNAHLLRAVAAHNSSSAAKASPSSDALARPALGTARKANEERKALNKS